MQDKLIVRFLNRSINRELEIDLNNISDNKILFSFNEYEDISIEMDSKIYTVKLECLSCLEDEIYKSMDNNMLTLIDRKEYIISKNNSFDIGYRPSKYHIIINDSIKEYDCIFEVEYNHQVTTDGMNNIIESINKFISGLTIDFFNSQPINGLTSTSENNEFYIFEILYKYHSRLSLTCDKIIKDLKMNISSKIVAGPYMQKQNSASIRKNLFKQNDIIYSIKKVQTANNINNIILKKYLTKIQMIIKKCKFDLVPIIVSKDDEMRRLLSEITDEKINLSKKNAHFNEMMIENHIKSLYSDLETIKRWKNKLIEWSNAYDNVCFSIRKLLGISEMKTLDINNQISYSADFNMNYDYKFIADLYNLLSSDILGTQKRNSIGLFSNKKSFEIFEIYGFIVLQNIIKELGFKYVGLEKNTIFDFSSESEFKYLLDNKKITIKYDHYCEKYTNADVESVVNINSKNCKPDYIILFYEDDVLKNIVIVEMKYRNLKYLIDYNNGSTETDITLEDYSQLGYLRHSGRRPDRVVKNVMLLYPSKEEICFTRSFSDYIGLNPEIPFFSSNAYNAIKRIISENI